MGTERKLGSIGEGGNVRGRKDVWWWGKETMQVEVACGTFQGSCLEKVLNWAGPVRLAVTLLRPPDIEYPYTTSRPTYVGW